MQAAPAPACGSKEGWAANILLYTPLPCLDANAAADAAAKAASAGSPVDGTPKSDSLPDTSAAAPMLLPGVLLLRLPMPDPDPRVTTLAVAASEV
jgi:hypothetical protein